MVNSMTGYASLDCSSGGVVRTWEIRSVNGRGLEMRLRLPDRLGRLEIPLREKIKSAAARGNVTLSLRLSREEGQGGAQVQEEGLGHVLTALSRVQTAAEANGLPVAPVTAADILGLPGVMGDANAAMSLPEDKVLLAEAAELLGAFQASRGQEGQALQETILGQIEAMAPLVSAAAERAKARTETAAERLKANISAALESAESLDPDRLAQEVAILTVKSDVTEEIDRLANAHIPAARGLLAADGPIGRRFDFLLQEFNREANTLCSKSQDAALTQHGLDLKVLIDQMREQIQNVE